MRRFSDLVSVARVDAAVSSIFGFFFLKKKKIEIREKAEIEAERERVEPDTVSHT